VELPTPTSPLRQQTTIRDPNLQLASALSTTRALLAGFLTTPKDTMTSAANLDIPMSSSPPPVPATDDEPKYGGYSRFEIELEVRG
jgi:hypothetical protein